MSRPTDDLRRTIPRFILVGLFNTAAGCATMFSLFHLAGFSYWGSSAIAYLLVGSGSFLLNRTITFGHQGPWAPAFLRFALLTAITYLAAYGLARPLVRAACTWLAPGADQRLVDAIALGAGMALMVVMGFLGQRHLVFAHRAAPGR